MLPIPPGLQVIIDRAMESRILDALRARMESHERDPRLHASDLLDPLQAYWKRTDPRPLTDAEVGLFFIGKVFESFVVTALLGKARDFYAGGDEQLYSERLGIVYSPDYIHQGKVFEIKFTRKPTLPQYGHDLGIYLEQCQIYMCAREDLEAYLYVYYSNVRDTEGKTHPIPKCYNLTWTEEDLRDCEARIIETRMELEDALDQSDPSSLPPCREWLCGQRCKWWDVCQPVGRYGLKKKDWER